MKLPFWLGAVFAGGLVLSLWINRNKRRLTMTIDLEKGWRIPDARPPRYCFRTRLLDTGKAKRTVVLRAVGQESRILSGPLEGLTLYESSAGHWWVVSENPGDKSPPPSDFVSEVSQDVDKAIGKKGRSRAAALAAAIGKLPPPAREPIAYTAVRLADENDEIGGVTLSAEMQAQMLVLCYGQEAAFVAIWGQEALDGLTE